MSTNYDVLLTTGEAGTLQGLVLSTLNKLPQVRHDVVLKVFYRTSSKEYPTHTRRRYPYKDPNREGVQRSTAGLNRWGNHILLGCSWQKGLHRQHIYVYQGDKGLWETVPPTRLGVEDQGEDDQLEVCSEFRENLVKRSDWWSEVGVAWGLGVKLSNTNEMASRKRLKNVERKLRRNKDLKI